MSKKTCPLCLREVPEEIYAFHRALDRLVIEMLQAQHPEWVGKDGACHECVDYYRRMAAQ